MAKSRVFVIGLDGGSWNVIDPLIARGKLPNLSRLKKEGAWGKLMSTFPPVTCPALYFHLLHRPAAFTVRDLLFPGHEQGFGPHPHVYL